MKSLTLTSPLLLLASSLLAGALSLPQDTTTTSIAAREDIQVDSIDAAAITCLSGLAHTLGTSCHQNAGSFACSGADRSHVQICGSNAIWAVYVTCPGGTGCHNCGCAPGY